MAQTVACVEMFVHQASLARMASVSATQEQPFAMEAVSIFKVTTQTAVPAEILVPTAPLVKMVRALAPQEQLFAMEAVSIYKVTAQTAVPVEMPVLRETHAKMRLVNPVVETQ